MLLAIQCFEDCVRIINVSSLAAAVIVVLGPYLSKGAEEFVKLAGKEAFEGAKKLYAMLRERLKGDDEATTNLDLYEKKPDRYTAVLTSVLEDKFAADPALASEVRTLLDQLGPEIHVLQQVQKADSVVGLRAKTVRSGDVDVTQEVNEAKEVLGVDIESVG